MQNATEIIANQGRNYGLCPTERAVIPPLHLSPLTVHVADLAGRSDGGPDLCLFASVKGVLLASVVPETENSLIPTTTSCRLGF